MSSACRRTAGRFACGQTGGSASRRRASRSSLQLEEELGLYDGAAFEHFRERVVDSKLALLDLLVEARKEGPIVGIGAPGRASTLLYYTGVTPELVDSIAELSGSLKIGQYTPGTHIPIVDERILYERQPPNALVLSWHIGDAIVPKVRERGYRGKFIIPLPEPRIVD